MNSRSADIDKLLRRPTAFPGESGKCKHPLQCGKNGVKFVPGDQASNNVRDAKVLVVGAGGLGCELLKNLALSGFSNLTVIDADVIDVSPTLPMHTSHTSLDCETPQ